MNPQTFPDDVWIQHGPAMFIALIGGDTVWAIVVDHVNGMSDREIAQRHNVPKTTARRWIRQAKVKMRQAGLNAEAIQGYAARHRATCHSGTHS